MKNKLNDLDPKTWLKFQKSWFIHNPPPRKKDVLVHPAKFPESMAQEFIEFFTKRGESVLDPMAGTGSALVAALRAGRNAYGIELNPKYAGIARQSVAEERTRARPAGRRADRECHYRGCRARAGFRHSDHRLRADLPALLGHAAGQRRRDAEDSGAVPRNLDVFYSDDPNDLGNLEDYEEFLAKLVAIYQGLKPLLRQKAYLTIIVKNVKKGGKIYPLAWDLGRELGKVYTLKDEKLWCQDNQRLAPYGLGSAWVSNTFHHYCLQFRNEE